MTSIGPPSPLSRLVRPDARTRALTPIAPSGPTVAFIADPIRLSLLGLTPFGATSISRSPSVDQRR